MGHVVQEDGLGAVGMVRRSQRFRKRLPARFKLIVFFLKRETGSFLFLDFFFCAFRVPDKQKNNEGGNCKKDRGEQGHMIRKQIHEIVGIQSAGIPERNILRIIFAQHIDAAVQQLQQPFVANLYAEAMGVVIARLTKEQTFILPVPQDVVRPQTVQRNTSCFTGKHCGKAILA